jgi:hypothetical protein
MKHVRKLKSTSIRTTIRLFNLNEALSAMKEAEKCLAKANLPVAIVQGKQDLISLFIEAKKMSSNLDACENLCAELLNHPEVNVCPI